MNEPVTNREEEGSIAALKPRLSIVIPTYNRRDILLKTLEAYKKQTAAHKVLELVVVDDGSTDGTQQAVMQSSLSSPFPIRCLRQVHAGLSAGRNHAISESRGQLLLFGDDDIFPAPVLVEQHLSWHEKYGAISDGVLGRVAWSPDLKPTPLMKWLGQDGVLFSFRHFSPGTNIAPGGFYFCNTSLKREFLLQNGMFDEEFGTYGFEDIELGRRLVKKGLRIFYNPDAVGYHYKRMSLADVWRRAEAVESAYPLYMAKIGAKQGPRPARKRSAPRAALRSLGRVVLPLTAPALRLFDTRIPFPWVVYRTVYFHYILPTARARVHASEGKAVPPLSKAQQGAE